MIYSLLWLRLAQIAAVIVIGAIVLDQLLRWMERRDWIYYKRKRPQSSTRAALSFFQELVQPEIQHVKEEQKQRAATIEEKKASDD